jgi:dTMP kinase
MMTGGDVSLFITFEGVEGSGKTTQIKRLQRHLKEKRFRCFATREPGGTIIGEKIRKILLDRAHREMMPLAELFLYEAARAQHVSQVILPLLKKGGIILCDRFSDASIAYQGHGRKIDPKLVDLLNQIASKEVRPDLTFLLDCPSSMGLKRAGRRDRQKRSNRQDRFEREQIQFHHRVRRGYLSLARQEPRRIKIIDTRDGEEKVFEKIRKTVDRLIHSRRSKI